MDEDALWFALDDHIIRSCYEGADVGQTSFCITVEDHGGWVHPQVSDICRGDFDALPIFEGRAAARYKKLFDVDVRLRAVDASCVLCVSWKR
jgi:hypothetical protein